MTRSLPQWGRDGKGVTAYGAAIDQIPRPWVAV